MEINKNCLQKQKAITAWLKEERIKKGYTKLQVAKLIGTSKLSIHNTRLSIHNMERNRIRLDIIDYYKYCKVLKLNPITGIKIISDNEFK